PSDSHQRQEVRSLPSDSHERKAELIPISPESVRSERSEAGSSHLFHWRSWTRVHEYVVDRCLNCRRVQANPDQGAVRSTFDADGNIDRALVVAGNRDVEH